MGKGDTAVHVAVGVIIDAEHRICITKRPKGKHLAGYWEFPGGKVEAGEAVFDALKRELYEEIGLTILASESLTKITYTYPEKTVLLDVHSVREYQGIARGRESQELRWVSTDELSELKFPEANEPIVRALQGL